MNFPFRCVVGILKKAVADDTHSAQRIPHYFTHPRYMRGVECLKIKRIARSVASEREVSPETQTNSIF